MKRILALIVALVCCIGTARAANTIALEEMSRSELLTLQEAITQELKQNHETSSEERDKILEVTKQATEAYFSRFNISISWAWLNYEYTKDWNFFSIKTHVDFKDGNGDKQKPEVYGEVYQTNEGYQLIYLKVGDEEIHNNRAALPSDYRTSVDSKKLASTSSDKKAVPVTVTPQPTIKVSAAALIKAYDNNEVKADATYKGQLLEVSGKVAGVKSSWGSTFVEIGTGSAFEWGIDCKMEKSQKDTVAQLDTGDSITIIGVCEGLSFLSVSLDECRIK